jgi:hypothetical protein
VRGEIFQVAPLKSFGYRGCQFPRNLVFGKLEGVLMRANHATTFSMERMDNQPPLFARLHLLRHGLYELLLFLIIADLPGLCRTALSQIYPDFP